MKRAHKTKRQSVAKKHNRPRHARVQHVAPQTAKQFAALSKEAQGEWVDVAHAISKMRASRMSLAQAATEVGVGSQTVTRLAKSALRRNKNGRFVAKRSDKLLRILTIPTADGCAKS